MLTGFINGIVSYGKAVQFISRLRLWTYVFIPGFLSLLLGIAVIFLVWNWADDIGNWLVEWYPYETGQGFAGVIGTILSSLLLLITAVLLFKYLILIFAAPFMSPLSEKMEQHLRGKKITSSFSAGKWFGDILRGIRLALRNIFWEVFFTLALLLAGFLLPVVSPFTALMIFFIQAYYAGFGNMDYTMERHLGFGERIAFVRNNRGLAIGNGAVFLLLLLTGIGFLFALPLATAAATVETVKRLNTQS